MGREINKALRKFNEAMVWTVYIKKNKYNIFLVAQMTKYSMGWSVTSLMSLMDLSRSKILQHNQRN